MLLILLAGGVLPTLAQAGYTIPWYSIGSLCDQASGGGYTLNCSAGGVSGAAMTGGSYSLTSVSGAVFQYTDGNPDTFNPGPKEQLSSNPQQVYP